MLTGEAQKGEPRLTQKHGRPVCRPREGGKCPPPRFCESNVKSLILTIGAPPPSFHSHRAPMLKVKDHCTFNLYMYLYMLNC